MSTKGELLENKDYKTWVKPEDINIPIVVLIAVILSASEIVSGSLQDMDRAVVVGTTSYGKGFQRTYDLKYGCKVKLTVANTILHQEDVCRGLNIIILSNKTPEEIPDSLITKYKTVNGRVIDGRGI